MKITLLSAIITSLTLGLFTTSAVAKVPSTLTYSGHLSDEDLPVEGTANAVFELFADQSGGTPAWSETHNGLTVDAGLLTTELGQSTDLTALLTGDVYWLQVTVDGQILLPRTPFRSMPYSRKAAECDTLEGHSADDLKNAATPSAVQVSYDNSTSGLTGTTVQAALDELLGRIAALESKNADLQAALDNNTSIIATNSAYIKGNSTAIGKNKDDIAAHASTIADNISNISGNSSAISDLAVVIAANTSVIEDNTAAIEANAAGVSTNTSNITDNAGEILDLQTLTASMSLVADDLFFTGVNVNVVSGSGTTDGTVNGLGNLIVGYNESDFGDPIRTGSHNLVVGPSHSYSSYSGMVVGYRNSIQGAYSVVSGGQYNTASGDWSAVSGGGSNTASAEFATVQGGISNMARGRGSSVSGGNWNHADGYLATVSGGFQNAASGELSTVSGGADNTASGLHSSVSGGAFNTAGGESAVVSGGTYNFVYADFCTVGGGAGILLADTPESNDYDWAAGDLLVPDDGSLQTTDDQIPHPRHRSLPKQPPDLEQ